MALPDAAADTAPPRWAAELRIDDPGLVTRLLRLHLLFGRLLDTATASSGITEADYLVLAVIERSPDGGSPTHVATVLGRSTGGLTLTLDRLESAGWIERVPDPVDRRRIRLQLLPAGEEILGRVRAALHGWENDLALDPNERNLLFGGADALLAVFGSD